jgi:hypothetical protein
LIALSDFFAVLACPSLAAGCFARFSGFSFVTGPARDFLAITFLGFAFDGFVRVIFAMIRVY